MRVRYRGTPSAMWRQQVRFAEAHVYLYHQYRANGMPRSSWRKALQTYLKLARSMARLRGQDETARLIWLQQAAVCWGHLRGSWRYRVLYL